MKKAKHATRLSVKHGWDGDRWRLWVFGTEPPGLNVLLRMHWRARKRRQEDMRLILLSQGALPKIAGPVTVNYCRSYFAHPLDEDNLHGSFKLVGDALKNLGVIEDDKPKILRLVAAQKPRAGRAPYFFLWITRGHAE